MTKVNNSPKGLKTYLPKEAQVINNLKQKVNDIFAAWGYKPIITPTMEYNEVFKIGMGKKESQNVYKLINREGNIIALRPENTSSVVRTVANRIKEIDLPARYSYFAPVFRYDPHREINQEINQMGIELIGENESGMAEVIIIAVEALKNTGVENFKLDIGHIGYVDAVLNYFNLSPKVCNKIKLLLAKRNLAGFQDFLADLPKGNIIKELLLLRGGRECLEKAAKMLESKSALKALDELKYIYDFLSDYGIEDYINLDLSLLRNLKYYSGIIFEGFTEKLGYFICGGGRYDNFIEKYHNTHIPAAGFALNIDRVRKVVKNVEQDVSNEIMVAFYCKKRSEALSIIKKLHKVNKQVVMKVINQKEDKKEIIAQCKNKGIEKIIFVGDEVNPEIEKDNSKFKVINLNNNEVEYIDFDVELKGWLNDEK